MRRWRALYVRCGQGFKGGDSIALQHMPMRTSVFVAAALTVLTAPTHSAQTPVRQTAIVIANAPIYSEAILSRTPLRVAAVGTVLTVLSEQPNWVQVEFKDPQFGLRWGWVERSLVTLSAGALEPMDLSVGRPAPVDPVRAASILKPCVIVKVYQKKGADALVRWTVPKPFNYVEGEFPNGFKFRNELNDGHVREIKAKNGHVVVLKSDYVLADLEDARRSCASWQAGQR